MKAFKHTLIILFTNWIILVFLFVTGVLVKIGEFLQWITLSDKMPFIGTFLVGSGVVILSSFILNTLLLKFHSKYFFISQIIKPMGFILFLFSFISIHSQFLILLNLNLKSIYVLLYSFGTCSFALTTNK